MPIAVTKFKCAYRCGKNATDRDRMVAHERECRKRPEDQASEMLAKGKVVALDINGNPYEVDSIF